MLNFGLTEMRLVSPRDGWPNPSAGPAASGADIVLEQARVFETLADAVADCAHVYATTVRKRGVTKPVVTPEEAARAITTAPGRSAIVFGPERSGLETDDVALARAILTVPINPEFGSLNLAQAVILCAYEWSRHVQASDAGADPADGRGTATAPQDEFEGMFAQLTEMLEPRGYFEPPSRAAATRRTLRTMLTKPGWNHLEIRTLRGVLSAAAHAGAKGLSGIDPDLFVAGAQPFARLALERDRSVKQPIPEIADQPHRPCSNARRRSPKGPPCAVLRHPD
jgi:tRNA/rRNA methyltransferase